MTLRCSICRLGRAKQQAVDAALRSGASLQAVANEIGVTKTSLWRHAQHMAGGHAAAMLLKVASQAKTPPTTPPKTVRPSKPAVSTLPDPALPAPASKTLVLESQIDAESSRQRAQARMERLWSEVEQCLTLAREPMVVVKPDGSELQVPVDLRTRSYVVRAGKEIVDLDARLNGLYDAAPTLHSDMIIQNVILMPKTFGPPIKQDTKIIDVQAEPAAFDGRPPDTEK